MVQKTRADHDIAWWEGPCSEPAKTVQLACFNLIIIRHALFMLFAVVYPGARCGRFGPCRVGYVARLLFDIEVTNRRIFLLAADCQ